MSTLNRQLNFPAATVGYMYLTRLCLSLVSYDRILSIENLSDVPNPWKGFTMNRCIVLALVVLLVSSGVHELHGEYCLHFKSI